MKYTANISSICPLPSPAHHGYSSSAWRVFHLIHTVSRWIIQQFWWMVRKYQSKLDRRDCNMQLSSKVMWTQRTFKSRQRLAVLIGIETHNTMFFHIHPATVILPYRYTVAYFYIFVHQIFACLRTQHLAICRKDLWKMPAEVRHHCLWKDSQVVNTNMQGFRDLVKWQMKRQYDETKFALLHILLNLSRRGRLLDGTEDLSPSEESRLIRSWQQIRLEFCNNNSKREIAPIANTTLPPYRLFKDSACVSQRSMGKHYSPDFTAAIQGLTQPLFAICFPPIRGRHARPLKWRHRESWVTYRLLHRHHGRCVRLK